MTDATAFPKPAAARRKSALKTASTRDSFNASAGGAGGGTAMVAIAHQIGLHTVTGIVLLYVAPVAAVLFGATLHQLRRRLAWYSERAQVKKARKTLEELLDKPDTSEEHKAQIRKMLEELDHSVASAELERVKAMRLFDG